MTENKVSRIQINFSDALCFSKEASAMSCNECNYSTTKSYNLMRHRDSVHLGTIKTTFCDQCCKTVLTKSFKKHVKTVHDGEKRLEKKIKCEKCSYLARPNILRTHVSIAHMGELLECSGCDNKYKSLSALRVHRRIVHEGWQPELKMCDKCDFQTERPSILREHDNVTHGGYLIKCGLCKNEYRSKHTLRIHMTSYHEGKQPKRKPCDICFKMIEERFMGQHLNSKHPGNFECEKCNSNRLCRFHFKCNQCNFIAMKSSGLTLHKKIKHKTMQKNKIKLENENVLEN